LGNGFFVSLNNQTISQTKTVTNDFSFFGQPKEFIGDVSAPLYPGIYAAFNAGDFSVSAGFNPIGGGGGAKYKTGLPSFEMPISAIPASLTGAGINTSGYSADILFEGSSIYFGFQLNVAYKLNDQLSVGAGLRMVSAKNTYAGSIENIKINPNQPAFDPKYNGTPNSATDFFEDGRRMYANASKGFSDLELPDVTPLSALPATAQGQLKALLGLSDAQIAGMNLGQAITGLNGVAADMAENSAKTKNTYADVEEKGTGFTPILSVNYSPSDMFNFSLRYEFKTNLKLKTTVKDNKGAGIFKDAEEIVADMPALLALGAEVKPIEKLAIAATFNMFFDKNVDYSGRNTSGDKMIDKNYMEYGLGVEYSFTEKFRASVGWLGTNTGILPAYQNDQRFSSNSNSFGLGVGYRITPLIDINLGGQYSLNAKYDKVYPGQLLQSPGPQSYTETYSKKTMIFAIGLDFYFGK
jgi:long-subunit fatty acid transport protein